MINRIKVSYDPFADVLYLSVGQPEKAISHQDSSGLVWRNKIGHKDPFAVTIIDFKDTWSHQRRGDLISEISQKLRIPVRDVEDSLPT